MAWLMLFLCNFQHSIAGFLRNSSFLPLLPIMDSQSPLKIILKTEGLVFSGNRKIPTVRGISSEI